MNNKRGVITHAVCWLLFIAGELSLIGILTGKKVSLLEYLPGYLANISLLYLHANWALERSIGKRRPQLLPFFVAVEMTGYLVLSRFFFSTGSDHSPPIDGSYCWSAVCRAVFFMTLGTCYWFAMRAVRLNANLLASETEMLRYRNDKLLFEHKYKVAERAHLRSQINPHLLFNILNLLYISALNVSDEIANEIIVLSDIMRYSLNTMDEDGKVALVKEILHIDNLLYLNRLRYNHKVFLSTDFQLDDDEVRIIPLVLTTFVENVLVHADLTDPQNEARIVITCKEKVLHYSSVNKKKRATRLGNGIGMKNSMARLESYYSDKFHISLNDTHELYNVNLKIQL